MNSCALNDCGVLLMLKNTKIYSLKPKRVFPFFLSSSLSPVYKQQSDTNDVSRTSRLHWINIFFLKMIAVLCESMAPTAQFVHFCTTIVIWPFPPPYCIDQSLALISHSTDNLSWGFIYNSTKKKSKKILMLVFFQCMSHFLSYTC